jgi:hypothetical protein
MKGDRTMKYVVLSNTTDGIWWFDNKEEAQDYAEHRNQKWEDDTVIMSEAKYNELIAEGE